MEPDTCCYWKHLIEASTVSDERIHQGSQSEHGLVEHAEIRTARRAYLSWQYPHRQGEFLCGPVGFSCHVTYISGRSWRLSFPSSALSGLHTLPPWEKCEVIIFHRVYLSHNGPFENKTGRIMNIQPTQTQEILEI